MQTVPQAHESAFSALSGSPVTQKTPVPAIGPNLINPLLQYGDRGQGWSHLSHDLNRSGRSYSLAQKISLFATVPRVKSNFTKMTPQMQPLWVCVCFVLFASTSDAQCCRYCASTTSRNSLHRFVAELLHAPMFPTRLARVSFRAGRGMGHFNDITSNIDRRT